MANPLNFTSIILFFIKTNTTIRVLFICLITLFAFNCLTLSSLVLGVCLCFIFALVFFCFVLLRPISCLLRRWWRCITSQTQEQSSNEQNNSSDGNWNWIVHEHFLDATQKSCT